MIRARTLNDLIERYDAFLVDQFGVLLDSSGAYGHARGALDELVERARADHLAAFASSAAP